jgi:hypothetical protein
LKQVGDRQLHRIAAFNLKEIHDLFNFGDEQGGDFPDVALRRED